MAKGMLCLLLFLWFGGSQVIKQTDCYFCVALLVSGGITKKKKCIIVYPNIPSALRPVSHGEGISVPEPTEEL
jgi:hypothetical protein